MVQSRSQNDPRRTAERMPVETPSTSQMIEAPTASDRVIGKASFSTVVTGWPW